MRHCFSAAAAALFALGTFGACAEQAGPSSTVDGPAVEIGVAALEYGDFASARYAITTYYLDDDGVMQPLVNEADFLANGPRGALTYISPCLASDAGPRLGQVTIEVLGLYDNDGVAITDLVLPPAQTQQFLCSEEQDTRVAFQFTIVRSADQGFADITVDIDDIFCSAKIDCQPDLYPHPDTGVRGPALVFGLACTGGNEVELGKNLLSFSFDSDPETACPGIGAAATFTGFETFGNKAFWNTILPLYGDGSDGGCVLDATAFLYSHNGDERKPAFQNGAASIKFQIALDGTASCADTGAQQVSVGYVAAAGVHDFSGDAAASKDNPVDFQSFEIRPAMLGQVSGFEARVLDTGFPYTALQVSGSMTFGVGSADQIDDAVLATACAEQKGAGSAFSALYLVVASPGQAGAAGALRGAVRLDYADGQWGCNGGTVGGDGGPRYCALDYTVEQLANIPCFASPEQTSAGPFGGGQPQ